MGSIAKPIPIKPVSQVPGNDSESKDADSTTGSSPESNTNMDQEAEPITVPTTSEPNGRRLSESPKGFVPIGAKRGNPQPIRVKGRRRSYSFSDSEDENDELDNMIFNSAAVSAYCDQLGIREQPFPPMVNRDMLCSLVRRSFDQTEEQQVQYEQILRHEYSRKSKGEVRGRREEGEGEREGGRRRARMEGRGRERKGKERERGGGERGWRGEGERGMGRRERRWKRGVRGMRERERGRVDK